MMLNGTGELLGKLRRVEERVSAERGPFNLFALFQRENAPLGWDLVVSAPWLRLYDPSLDAFVSELRQDLRDDDMMMLSRIAVIPPDFEGLGELAEEHPVEHGNVLIRNREFGLQMVEKGYLITARPPLAKAA